MTGAERPDAPAPGAAPAGVGAGRVELFRFVVFAAFLGLWTWKLLEPHPVPEELAAQLGSNWKFVLAKSLHAGAYAFLTVLVFALPVPRRWHWVLVVVLALHGAATEFGQTFVPNRTGTKLDVIIDWVGIALGCLARYGVRRLTSGRPVPPAERV